jgi:hypothetical protein
MRRTVVEPAGSDIGAIEEAVAFLDYFKELPDPRQAGKVIYPLAEVLLLCLLAVLAGAESFVDIARFGERQAQHVDAACSAAWSRRGARARARGDGGGRAVRP